MKKNYVILGFIAIVMMLVIPAAMAATSATINAQGTVNQTLSISTNTASINFNGFQVGQNELDNQGTLTVTSAFIPHWTVTAGTSDGYGYMRTTGNTPLTKPFQEYNYLATTQGFVNAQGMSFAGNSSTTMAESFRQEVLITDTPGSYSTVITYTISAV